LDTSFGVRETNIAIEEIPWGTLGTDPVCVSFTSSILLLALEVTVEEIASSAL